VFSCAAAGYLTAAAAEDESVEPMDAVVFTVIVDDLVFPDGVTKMGVMGGEAAHSPTIFYYLSPPVLKILYPKPITLNPRP
jgi:hypothetical protein